MARSTAKQDIVIWEWVVKCLKDDSDDIGNILLEYISTRSYDATPLFDALADICDPTDIFKEEDLIRWYEDGKYG